LYLGDGQRLHGEVGRILAGSQSSEQLARAEIIDYDLWLNNRVPIANQETPVYFDKTSACRESL
jgi:hypothetical protein